MQTSDSVENALHLCLILERVPKEQGLSAGKLAEAFGLPATSTAKLLQQLAAANLVSSREGRSGGYRLAREADRITLLEIVLAVDGNAAKFKCREIRQHGACGAPLPPTARPCMIAQAMRRAELAWRKALAGQTLRQLADETEPTLSPATKARGRQWLAEATHTL